MLGIEVPNQVRVLSVLGARREVFALISYRGQRGITGLLNLRLGLWEPDAAEHGPNQDVLLAGFVPREELEPEDLAVMEQLKYKVRAGKPRLYPQFRSYLPGYAPWFLDPTEAEGLRHDLLKMAEFAQLLRRDSHLFDQRAMCEIPFYPSTAKGSLSVAQLQWRTLLPSPKPKEPPFGLDRIELEKLSALPQRQDFCWELDTFYTYDRIVANPRPYMARVSLAMDAVSGQVLAVRGAALEVTFALCSSHRGVFDRGHAAQKHPAGASVGGRGRFGRGVDSRSRCPGNRTAGGWQVASNPGSQDLLGAGPLIGPPATSVKFVSLRHYTHNSEACFSRNCAVLVKIPSKTSIFHALCKFYVSI